MKKSKKLKKIQKGNNIIKILFVVGVVIVIILIILFAINSGYTIRKNSKFISVGEYLQNASTEINQKYANIDAKENYVFQNYEDYYNVFDSNELTKKDFEKNNYVLITIYHNTCSQGKMAPTKYKIKKNNINVTVEYVAKCGYCAADKFYYLVKVEKNITNVNVNIDYKAVNYPICN